MREEGPGPGLFGLLVLIVMGVAGLLWTSLSTLARPARADEQLAALDTRSQQLRQLARTPATAAVYPPRAVCSGIADKDIGALRQGLLTSAKPLNLTLADLDVAPSAAGDGAARRIAPVRISFSTEGGYDEVVALLNQLASAKPQLFVDSLDLTSHTSSVNLKFSGKVFCWTSAAH